MAFDATPTVTSHLAPLIPTKIPENYLFSQQDQRFELLQGILCSSAAIYHEKTKTYRVYQYRRTLIYAIQYLADSIGCKTEMKQSDISGRYILYIKTKRHLLPLTQQLTKAKHTARRFVVSIDQIRAQQCVHIETDGQDNTILVGEGFIACH